MTNLKFPRLGSGLALASIGLAHADGSVAGAWKLTVGVNGAPAPSRFTPDASGVAGTIDSGADCPSGLNTVCTWKATGGHIQLLSVPANSSLLCLPRAMPMPAPA